VTEHIDGIVTDGEDDNVLAFKVGQTALQLDELRLAEGSPGGAAMEDYQGPTAASGLVQAEGVTMLIWQHHVGKTRTHGRTDRAKVNTEIRDCSHGFLPYSQSPEWRWSSKIDAYPRRR
jgi:hypothetical protein